MIMGAGKSTVVCPLLALLLADGKSLVTLVVPKGTRGRIRCCLLLSFVGCEFMLLLFLVYVGGGVVVVVVVVFYYSVLFPSFNNFSASGYVEGYSAKYFLASDH
jgi:hypothetical protein